MLNVHNVVRQFNVYKRVCSFRPDLIDFSRTRSQSNRENLQMAFDMAEKQLNVTRLLDPEGRCQCVQFPPRPPTPPVPPVEMCFMIEVWDSSVAQSLQVLLEICQLRFCSLTGAKLHLCRMLQSSTCYIIMSRSTHVEGFQS